jgi:hypothetical protein
MNVQRVVASLSGLAWCATALAGPPPPALFYEQTTQTTVDGRTADPSGRVRVWFAGAKLRMEHLGAGGKTEAVLIVRLDRGKAYRLDPAAKTTWESDLDREQAESQMELGLAGDVVGSGVRTARLRGTRQIAGYVCQGYRLSSEAGYMELWLSEMAPARLESFAGFFEWLGVDQSLEPIMEAVKRLPGFPLETRSRMNVAGRVVETRSTILTLRAEPADAGLFEPTPGYRVEREGIHTP